MILIKKEKSFFFLIMAKVILMGSYSTSFFIIFGRVSQNLVKLKELMRSIEEEGVDLMQDILRFNYTMFKYVV